MSSALSLMASFAEQLLQQSGLQQLSPAEQEVPVGRRHVANSVAASNCEAGSRQVLIEDEAAGTNVVSEAEISKHKSKTDTWVVVDGVVYDISQFIDTHPGGAEVTDIYQFIFLVVEILTLKPKLCTLIIR